MISQKDNEEGKLFVGGLSWDTQCESLQRYFSRYGEVIDCVVMKNNETGRSRGFGFITFADPENVQRALDNCPHNLDGRTIDPKPCNPRSLHKPKRSNAGYPKVFLGGLPANVTESDLRSFFGRYGQVMEVVIMYDQEKKKSRGFGFLSFDNDAAVDRATADHFINLNGKQVEIKKAEPRDGSANHMMPVDPNQSMGGGSHWGGPMMGNGTFPMGLPNMNNTGFQQWNTSQSGYNYGSSTPSNPSFGAWPQQWGNNNYGVPPHQAQQSAQGYGAYDYGYNSATAAGNYGANGGNWNSWNPNITNVAPNTGSAAGSTAEMYPHRPQSGHNMHAAPPQTGNISKPGSDYNGGAAYGNGAAAYGNYYNEQQAPPAPFSNQNRPRSYGGNNEQYPAF